MEKIFSEEVNVTIRVVNIENKKLTKSVFNQLHYSSPFTNLFDLKDNVKVLGYVNDKEEVLLWSDENKLYKYRTKALIDFVRISFDTNTIEDLYKLYRSKRVQEIYFSSESCNIGTIEDEKLLQEITAKQDFLKMFYRELKKNQIFI